MRNVLYHIEQNSFYVKIVRIRYQNEKYIKAHLQYFYKTSMVMFAEEKSVKIMKDVMKHWQIKEST